MRDAGPGRPGKRWLPLVALGVFVAATVIATHPVAWKLDEGLAGDGADANLFVWNHWWLAKALDEGKNPYHADQIYWPTGTSLVLHTFSPYHGVLSLALAPMLGQVATFNVLWLLSFVLAAWSGYLLAREVTGSEAAGYVAGFAFGFTGYHYAHGLGHLNLMAYQWMAFFLYFLLRFARSGRRRDAFYAALMVVGAGLTDYGTLFTVALLSIVFTLSWMGWRSRDAWRVILVPGIMAAAMFLPWMVMILREILRSPELSTFSAEAERYSVDVLSYVVPTHMSTLYEDVGRVLPPNGTGTESTVFLGYLLLALAAYGAWRSPWVRTRPYAITAIVFYVLSLGPTLIVGGIRTGIPMPYTLLTWTPILSTLRTPARFGLIVALCVAVIAAMGVVDILGRLSRLPRPRMRAAPAAVAALFCAVILVESAFVPFPMTPLRASSLYADAAALDTEAIVDLPLHQPGYAGQLGRVNYLAAQTQHELPIVNGYNARQTTRDTQTLHGQVVLSLLGAMELALPAAEADDIFPQQETREVAGDLLARRGMVALLLHRSDPPTETEAKEIALLATMKGIRLVKEGEDAALYEAVRGEAPPHIMFDLATGWHGVELFDGTPTRWMTGEGDVLLHVETATTASLTMNVTPFLGAKDPLRRLMGNGLESRTLRVLLDGEVVAERETTGGWTTVDATLRLTEGTHVLTLQSVERGIVPRHTGLGWDVRELSFAVQGVRVEPKGG